MTCPDDLPGASVNAAGCPLPIPGDIDGDGDVDQSDFGLLQACFSGATVPQPQPACALARLDADPDVDQADFDIFHRCYSGPNLAGDPACAAGR
jgi:hypothetical protein